MVASISGVGGFLAASPSQQAATVAITRASGEEEHMRVSVLHGLLAGSDSGSLPAILLYVGVLAAVGATVFRKLLRKPPRRTTNPRMVSGEGGKAA